VSLIPASLTMAGTFVACAVLVGGIRRWVSRRGLLAMPNARSSHVVPTPTAGGIGIVAAVLAALAVHAALSGADARVPAALAAAGLMIAAVSFVDDVRGVRPIVRLVIHLAAALLIALAAQVTPILLLFAVLWIAGLTNAYNFMDGIDGIAGGQAVVAGVTWMMLGSMAGLPLVAVLGAALAGSSLGFLIHNWPPARIFMGDVGSAFLGAMFGAMVALTTATPTLAAAGALAVWPFVFDASFTLIRRLRRRENIFEAHRSHLYQRLTIAGFSHGTVSAIYAGLAMLGGAIGLGIASGAVPLLPLPFIAIGAAALGLWLVVLRVEGQAA
jgi:UDP-N-acetylmuramyl pentapeptide phosphotransferase/UDP-N-acetylglucosamine-1-phosphate transferase